MAASRGRLYSLRRIHAIARATGLSASDLPMMADIALDSRSGRSLSGLSDDELWVLSDFLARWQLGLDVWRLGGAFTDVVRSAWNMMTTWENTMSEDKNTSGVLSVEEKLASFRDEVNSSLSGKKTKTETGFVTAGANGELRNPEYSFDMLDDEDAIRSGITALDLALGVGGLKRGTFNVIEGPSGSMKTGLSLHFVKWAQDHGVPVFYFDAENALTPTMMKMMGIDHRKMLVSGTSKLDVLHGYLRKINTSFTNALIVLDSLPAFLAPSTYEKDNASDSGRFAGEAAMWNEILSREIDDCFANKNTIIAVNQQRKNFDSREAKFFPTKAWGTQRIEYAASTYIVAHRPRKGDKKTDEMGFTYIADKTMRLHLKKNKSALPGVDLEIPVIMGKGVDFVQDLIDRLLDLPVEHNPLFYPRVRYDVNKDEFKNSNSRFCTILISDEVLDLIRQDEPDFEPNAGAYHVWSSKIDEDVPTFHVWLERHPAYLNYARDHILRWLIDYRSLCANSE